MKKPFDKRLKDEKHKNTLSYDIDIFKKACKNLYDSINDWLIKYINTLLN